MTEYLWLQSSRASTRQSAKPKRYADSLYSDSEAIASGLLDPSHPETTGDPSSQQLEDESDDEGSGILRATSHIWREPLQQYILTLHAQKRKVEEDFEKNEQSRMFVTAARIAKSSERKIVEMRERKEVRLIEVQVEAERNARESEEAKVRAVRDEQKKAGREKEKEERLRKQREAARKKRDDDRAKKERDDENRKIRAEEARIAKIVEAERKAALTPEEREAEEVILAKLREEAAIIAKKAEEEQAIAAEGRGARKRRRPENDNMESEHHFNGYGEYDEHDELDEHDPYQMERPRSSKQHAGSRRSNSAGGSPALYPPGAIDSYGNPLTGYAYNAPPLPLGAYVGADGAYYDGDHQPLVLQPYASGSGYHGVEDYQGEYDEEGDGILGEEHAGETKPVKKGSASKRWKAIEDLERRVWSQIAKRDIPKVSRSCGHSFCRKANDN